jgi:hypothetical protein
VEQSGDHRYCQDRCRKAVETLQEPGVPLASLPSALSGVGLRQERWERCGGRQCESNAVC